jgi:hypothetical protein
MKKIVIEFARDVLELKGYEDEKIKIIDVIGISKVKEEVKKPGIFQIKKAYEEVVYVDKITYVKALIKSTGETITFSFCGIDSLVYHMRELFEKLYSDEVIGFTGRNVANFIRKNLDNEFIILTSLEEFTRIGGALCGNGSDKIKTGIIIPKEHLKEVANGFEKINFWFTNIIGMESTDGESICLESVFSDWPW